MTTNLLQHQSGGNSTVPHHSQEQPLENQQKRVIKKVKSLPRNLGIASGLQKSSSCATLNQTFNQSLITRIRGVSRLHQENGQLQKSSKEGQKWLSKLAKSKNSFQNIKQQFSKSRAIQEDAPVGGHKEDADEARLGLQIALQQQKRRNKNLSLQIQQYQCQIFIYKQQIEQLNSQIQEKDCNLREMEGKLKEREQEYWGEYQGLLENHENTLLKYQELCEQLQEKNQIIANFIGRQSGNNLKIEAVLEERVISVPSMDKMALLRANSELSSLKKQHEATLNEVRRKQELQLQQIRKKFVRNLNHYKEIIIKFTTKSSDGKNRSVLESTFTENSSNEQL